MQLEEFLASFSSTNQYLSFSVNENNEINDARWNVTVSRGVVDTVALEVAIHQGLVDTFRHTAGEGEARHLVFLTQKGAELIKKSQLVRSVADYLVREAV